MTDALKTCPFCGCLAWLYTNPSAFAGHTTGGHTGHRVECEGHCHAMTCWWHTREEAIANWNWRPTSPSPQGDEVERVARAMAEANNGEHSQDSTWVADDGRRLEPWETFLIPATAALSALPRRETVPTLTEEEREEIEGLAVAVNCLLEFEEFSEERGERWQAYRANAKTRANSVLSLISKLMGEG